MIDAQPFRGFRFPAEVILCAVRWYLQFPISYRDLEHMLADRGVEVDHTTWLPNLRASRSAVLTPSRPIRRSRSGSGP